MLAGDLTLAIRGRSLDASHASVRLANLKIDLLIQFWRILRKWQVDVASVEGGFVCSVTEWAFLNWGKARRSASVWSRLPQKGKGGSRPSTQNVSILECGCGIRVRRLFTRRLKRGACDVIVIAVPLPRCHGECECIIAPSSRCAIVPSCLCVTGSSRHAPFALMLRGSKFDGTSFAPFVNLA